MTSEQEIRSALHARADALDAPPPTLESVHREARGPSARGRGLLVAAAVLIVLAMAGALAWRDRKDTSSVTTKPPAPAADLPDPASLAYVPSFISDRSEDVDTDLVVTPTASGYRLVASTTSGDYTFTFDRAAKQPGRFGTSAAFSYGTVEKTPTSMRWSDAVGTVSVTVPASMTVELERLAQSLILVDQAAYERFLADPAQPIRSSSRPLTFGDVDAGTIRWEGEITHDGVLLRVAGKVSTSSSASLGISGPTDLGSWKSGTGAYQLLRVPAGFRTVEATEGQIELAGQIDDPTVGPLLLLHSDTLEPVTYRVSYRSGRAPDQYSLCVECD